MFWPGLRAKRMKSFAWFLSFVMILSLAAPMAVAVDSNEDSEVNNMNETLSLTVDLRATGMGGDVFEAAAYEVPAGEVTVGSQTLDSQTLDRHTAMGALAYYCQEEGIDIEITEGDWGLFVYQIGDNEADENSWMYYVNESSPWVGATEYDLSTGDALHFVNFNLDLYSLSLALDLDEIEPGDSLTAAVLYTDGSGDSTAVEGAEIFVSDTADEFGNPVAPGEPVGQTGASGQLTFTWNEPGTFYPYAQWDGKTTQYQWPVLSFSCGYFKLPEALNDTLMIGGQGFTIDYIRNYRVEAGTGIGAALQVDPENLFLWMGGMLFNIRSQVYDAPVDITWVNENLEGFWDGDGDWVDW